MAGRSSVGAAGRCARTGEAQLITDVERDPDYVAGNHEVRAEYLVPIRHRARLHGVLNIESTRAGFLHPEARAVFDAVADQIAGAIHLARVVGRTGSRQSQAAKQLSMIDGLTGIANRRCFDQRLAAEWEWLAVERRELALVLVDADCLQAAQRCARASVRRRMPARTRAPVHAFRRTAIDDLVARFGGEELVLLLPDRSLEAAVALGEALRRDVEAAAMRHDNSAIAPYVTVSIGVAAVTPTQARSPDRLIAAADRALYAAKAQGRNRVVAAQVE